MKKTVKNLPLLTLLLLLSACSKEESGTVGGVDGVTSAVPSAVSVELAKNREQTAEQLFDFHCLPCHAAGPGVAGTMRLAERLGPDQSVLLERDNLDPLYVKTVIRHGLFMMAPFRPAEISDAELQALSDFVASKGKESR